MGGGGKEDDSKGAWAGNQMKNAIGTLAATGSNLIVQAGGFVSGGMGSASGSSK